LEAEEGAVTEDPEVVTEVVTEGVVASAVRAVADLAVEVAVDPPPVQMIGCV